MAAIEVVGGERTRWQRVEAGRDEQLLRWLARFRFASADVLEARFGVSARMCRKRLARLEHAGLVVSHQEHLAAPKLYAVSGPGATTLGVRRRRAPRWGVQVVHELAVVRLAAEIETARLGARVFSERECRALEADREERFSVACVRGGVAVRRWPDIVIEGEGGRVAVEIELSPKTTERLKAILLGYLTDPLYNRVQIVCGASSLERRIGRLVRELAGEDVFEVSGL